MKHQVYYSSLALLLSTLGTGVYAQSSNDVILQSAVRDLTKNQLQLSVGSDIKYYSVDNLSNVSIDQATGLISLKTIGGAVDTYHADIRNLTFSKIAEQRSDGEISNNLVKITAASGWQESAYAVWDLLSTATSYNVYIKGGQYTDYTKIDAQLVRVYSSYGRADVVGLKAGSYSMKVVPVVNGTESTASEVTNLTVKNYLREGFAHKGYSGVGAYKDDGTLKNGAVVIYVDKSNAKTVTATLSSGTFTGLQAILTAYQKGNVTNPLDVRIIGLIKNGETDDFGSSSEGIQIKGKGADSELNITIEGIGNDATIHGFGFLVRNAKSVEFRNLGIMRQMDDGISLDTDNSNIWIHNVDVFYGKAGSGDHAKGDGAIDVKTNSKYVTVDYCHFWDTGKSSMCGMKSESGPNYITYHHNWFDHSDSRHGRIRTMSVHLWNNYYDGCAKYGMGATMGSSVFSEKNYFRDTKDPMLISMQGTDAKGEGTFSGENGGMIKDFGSVFVEKGSSSNYVPITYTDNKTSFDFYAASSRDEQVPSSIVTLQGATKYNNFDTDANLMYTYTPDAVADVPAKVTGFFGAGRINHGDLQYTFNNATEDADYAPISALETLIDNYAGEEATHGTDSGSSSSDSGTDSGTSDSGNQGTTISADVECNFESGAPSNSAFTVVGNYSTSKGSATVNGTTYTKCLKMESSTSISFTTTEEMTLTLVFADGETGSIKVDDVKNTSTSSTLTVTLAAGSHKLTKLNAGNLFYIGLKK